MYDTDSFIKCIVRSLYSTPEFRLQVELGAEAITARALVGVTKFLPFIYQSRDDDRNPGTTAVAWCEA